MPGAASAAELVHRVWADLGREVRELDELVPAHALPEVPLPARLDVSALAAGSVAAAAGVAAALTGTASTAPQLWPALDGARIATAFTSERWFTIDGGRPEVWAPLSGFRRAADGWVRTHANYAWHEAALRRALRVDVAAPPDVVAAAIAERSAAELEHAVALEGGLCVAVRTEDPAADEAWRRHPLVELSPTGAGGRPALPARDPRRPLAGVRVLDLTRVIAGPVGTRALAGLGADVLRIDPPARPEPAWQHVDTGAGKRSALLDLRGRADRARFDELLQSADAVVLGYRPAALDALGLRPDALVHAHQHLVVGQLSAWGYTDGAAERRGFDSIVQAASGIARIEGDAERPGALPAQALDHATGYLLAAAVLSMLGAGGAGERIARVSLRRTAAELLGMPRTSTPTPAADLDPAIAEAHLQACSVDGATVRLTRPALTFDHLGQSWPEGPRAWGRDAPRWPE